MNRRLLREQQGASSVIVALCMTAILIVVALVVELLGVGEVVGCR